jgi:hypothetical protein
MEVLEIVLDQTGGRGTVIAHVGRPLTRQSVALARHAEKAGGRPFLDWHGAAESVGTPGGFSNQDLAQEPGSAS